MRLLVRADGVELAEPECFGSFAASTALPTDHLDMAITALGVGRLDPDGQHIWVDPGVVEAAVGADRPADWAEGFAAMCAYADSRGWVDAEGRVRAHVLTGD